MDFVYGSSGLSDEQRKQSSIWIRSKLQEMMGESDDTFVEYITIMLGNQKTMAEIAKELEAFMGETDAKNFASELGTHLKKLGDASSKLLQKAIKSSLASNPSIPPANSPTASSKAEGDHPSVDHVDDAKKIADSSSGAVSLKRAVPLGALKSTRETSKEMGALRSSRDGPPKRRLTEDNAESRVVKLNRRMFLSP